MKKFTIFYKIKIKWRGLRSIVFEINKIANKLLGSCSYKLLSRILRKGVSVSLIVNEDKKLREMILYDKNALVGEVPKKMNTVDQAGVLMRGGRDWMT